MDSQKKSNRKVKDMSEYEKMFNDLIRGIGVITFGKERWIQQGTDTFIWYDRLTGRYCDKTELLVSIGRTIKELEDDFT